MSAPTGLVCETDGQSVYLSWEEMPDAFFGGTYLIYRGFTNPPTRIIGEVFGTRFYDVDPCKTPGLLRYYYAVSAMDRLEVESRMSEVVSIEAGTG